MSYFAFLTNHDSNRTAMELEYPGGTWTAEDTSKGEIFYWMYDYTRE